MDAEGRGIDRERVSESEASRVRRERDKNTLAWKSILREDDGDLTCASSATASRGMESAAPAAPRSDNIFSAANTMPVRR